MIDITPSANSKFDRDNRTSIICYLRADMNKYQTNHPVYITHVCILYIIRIVDNVMHVA